MYTYTTSSVPKELDVGESCAGEDSQNCKSGTTCDTGDVCSEYGTLWITHALADTDYKDTINSSANSYWTGAANWRTAGYSCLDWPAG